MTGHHKILVVDDSEVIRKITVRLVEDLGHKALEAETAKDAARLAQEEKPVAVFLDWDLPSMGALDFLKAAADLPPDARPEIILCATENDPQQFTLAKAAGAAHHILKPYDRDSVAAVLCEAGLAVGQASGAAPAVKAG